MVVSGKGISTIYRVSRLIRLLTEEKDLIQADKIKSYVYKYASPDDLESHVVRVATGRADFETHNERDILTLDEIEEALRKKK
jgi:hypothetical protein